MAVETETVTSDRSSLVSFTTFRKLSAGALKGTAVVLGEILAPANNLVDSLITIDREERQQRDIAASLALGQELIGRIAKGGQLDKNAISKEGRAQIRRAAEIHGLLDFGLARDQVTDFLQEDIDDMLGERPTLDQMLRQASEMPIVEAIAKPSSYIASLAEHD